MAIPIEIQKLMNRKNKDEQFVNLVYTLMSNFSMSYEDVKRLPFPIAVGLLNKIVKNSKEQEKQLKKIRSRGKR